MTNYNIWHKSARLQKRVISEKNFTYRFLINILKNKLTSDLSVLDIGCGVGTVDFYISKKVKNVLGIDVSDSSIKMAKSNSANFRLSHKVFFTKVNFPKNTIKGKYDLVICSEVLEHLQDELLATRRLYNLLKKEGIVLISVPLKTAPLYKLGLLKSFDKKVGHLRRYKINRLVRILEDSGLVVVKIMKTEGMFRNFLFTNKLGNLPIRFANKFDIISDIFTILDDLSGRLFGFSNVYVMAKK